MFVCISSFDYKRPMLWYLLRFLPYEQRVACLWYGHGRALDFCDTGTALLSQRLTTLMNVHLYFSYWVQKTNAQISITRTAAMPVLELTKIISRKCLLPPLRPLIPAPPNVFLLRDIGDLRVTSEFSLFVFLFSDSSIYPGSDTNH